MNTVIKFENVGKKYTLNHHNQQSYVALRDEIAKSVKNISKKIIHPLSQKKILKPTYEEFWALEDISFEIQQGDRVGIIGSNGAGKSTLLKVLSRITEPTTGRISIKGRVASLLEVGTGFHPELTGGENIYLNGAILGMSKYEIKKKYDDIVEFAGVEKFLDTPVKRYSSGMYMRLAFAVAAHLESEILIVDEVLAVGDAQFQKKCLNKMNEISKDGRTILFVSHSMNAIEQLCNSCIQLEKGHIKQFSTDVRSVIKEYLYDQSDKAQLSEWVNSGNDFENPWFKPLKFFISDEYGDKQKMPLSSDSDIWVQIEGEIQELDCALSIGYAVYDENGTLLYYSCQTDEAEEKWPKLEKGVCCLRSKIPKRFLNEGDYKIELIGSLYCIKWLFQPGKNIPSICLNIQGGLSESPYWMQKRPGLLAPVMEWKNIIEK